MIAQAPSIPHFKGLDMRNLQYEIRICQKPIIKSQCQCQCGSLFYDSDFNTGTQLYSVVKTFMKKLKLRYFLH